MTLTQERILHSTSSQSETLRTTLYERIAASTFPCVGAKAALARGTLDVLPARSIVSAWDDVRIHDRLLNFASAYRTDPSLFRSLAVAFEGPDDL